MITEDLVNYIQTQLRKNTPESLIASRLAKAGWHSDDIQEALRKVIVPITPSTTPLKISVKETPIQQNQIETQPIEIEAPTISREEESIVAPGPVMYIVPEDEQEEILPPMDAPIVINPVVPANLPIPEPIAEPKAEEFIPNLIPKAQKDPTPQYITPQRDIPEAYKGAMLSSYAQDISSVMQNVKTIPPTKKKPPIRALVFILVLLVLGGTAFASMFGYINIPMPNFSFIKKDPITLLANTPSLFSKLNSYKSKTNILVTTPSFSSITSGLVSGEVGPSTDRDSFSLRTEGIINKKTGSSPSFIHSVVLESSVLSDVIEADFKHDGQTLFITLPDLTRSLGENAPVSQTVSIQKGQFGIPLELIPLSIKQKASMIDIDKVLNNWVPLYANTLTSPVFKEFLTNAKITDKGKEMIQSKDTYHYKITPDRAAAKKFLSDISQVFLSSASQLSKSDIEDMAGSTTIDTFEVWVGKHDNAVHQYKFALSIPLSKVIGLEDKGIAGNVVTLEWVSTFYDFDVANEIIIPSDSIPVEDFMESINDMKVKDAVSSFNPIAIKLFRSTGSFGKKPNSSGSCLNPTPGSLFSPVGHVSAVSTTISSISSSLNTILSLTNNTGSCYSTTNAWAMAFPLPSTPQLYFCTDNTGIRTLLNTPITTSICK